ncbi:c6 zinc finger domain containing protein [Grosmannia clavigera kw1407]|uniref:C6 zinc finger domain containing protein n=1 Tax=Grosmannia clavigera (strain kw1407 / UAMH 11150) TaxID=655863 RepID=F0XBQ1_GROCL|nr:c6 zinc finger domain containing protein [Grosmannia clavigera kw1407]EFX04918.1 c6 zinc finger domain containing protein [Grosmannia clavigera kw1407]
MAEEVRPKLAQIPQGRDVPSLAGVPKQEDDDQDRRHRPQPLQLPANTVTLPSFREAYGSALAQYPAPPPPPAHQPYVDQMGRPGPRPPYPDSPNSSGRLGPQGPPGPLGPPGPMNGGGDMHYAPRLHAPDVASRENKDYYGGYPYNPYADRAPPPHPSYWAQHPMPPNYQSQPPESAPRQRTSIACKYCRKRKIRCSGYQNTPDGKCTNCKKTGNDCVFQPVSSTTSTAFVPVSAIQGGVPPGTPLYGAFGQPLGPNGGRGPAPANGPPGGPNGPNGGHGGMNGGGGPPPGYGPNSPGGGGYYQQQHLPSPMDQNGPPQQLPPSSQGPPSSAMSMRQLPLPYPQPNNGYPGEDQRRRNSKRPREDEEAEYSNRLPPPAPGYSNHSNNGYYGGPDELARAHGDMNVNRHSPPSMHGSSVPLSSGSPTNGHHGYGPLPPPPPMSSVGTDTSVRSNGSAAGTAATSPIEQSGARSPSSEAEDKARGQAAGWHLQQPHTFARECDLGAGRDMDRFMLNRLGSARPDPRPDYVADQAQAHLLRERV